MRYYLHWFQPSAWAIGLLILSPKGLSSSGFCPVLGGGR